MVKPSYTDDDNRVVLRPLEGHEDCQSDYINASYVDVSDFMSGVSSKLMQCCVVWKYWLETCRSVY